METTTTQGGTAMTIDQAIRNANATDAAEMLEAVAAEITAELMRDGMDLEQATKTAGLVVTEYAAKLAA